MSIVSFRGGMHKETVPLGLNEIPIVVAGNLLNVQKSLILAAT